MNIRGIYKTSLIDFPGRICTVLFTGGCNLRCRYCYNSALALNSSSLERHSNEEALSLLRKRKGLIDGVTLSGGEPTLSPNIEGFLRKVREISLDIKLDTNGLNPQVVDRLVRGGLLDYVALDVKTSPEKYEELTGRPVDFSAITETVDILRESSVPYEIRTTCVPDYVTYEDIEKIQNSIGPVQKYCLQQFVPSDALIDQEMSRLKPYPVATLRSFGDYIGGFSGTCEIRGI